MMALHPAKLLHRKSRVPDFRHVTDLIALEEHYVHVVGADFLKSIGRPA